MSDATMPTSAGQSYDLAGAVHRIVLDGAGTGGAATVAEVDVAPGAGVPPHSNAREDLVWHVIGGELEFHLPAGARSLEAGQAVHVPRDTVHAFFNTSGREAKVLMVAQPAGVEHFIREAAGAMPPGVPAGPPPPEAAAAFAELAARHGVTVMPPDGA